MRERNCQRRYDLDWLRVLAFMLLILFHTGMMFNSWDWHVKNPATSPSLEYVMRFLNQWRMPLLFFVSGAAVWFAMDKYTSGRFAVERLKRLGIPLLFGMFVIIPPQVYFERLFQGRNFHSFFAFYGTVLEFVPYPKGNFSWHHLWYIPYILAFSLLMLPLFRYLKTEAGRSRLSRVMDRLAGGAGIWLLFLPIAVSEISLRPFWPSNNNNLLDDWAQFSSTLLIFTFGFCFASSRAVWPRLDQKRFLSLALAATTTVYLHNLSCGVDSERQVDSSALGVIVGPPFSGVTPRELPESRVPAHSRNHGPSETHVHRRQCQHADREQPPDTTLS